MADFIVGDIIMCGNETFTHGHQQILPGQFQLVFRTGENEHGEISNQCKGTWAPRNYTGFQLHTLCFFYTSPAKRKFFIL